MRQGIVRRIFDLAEQLEPSRSAAWYWFFNCPIENSLTAAELVFSGRGTRVVNFLQQALLDPGRYPGRSMTLISLAPYRTGTDMCPPTKSTR